MLKEIRQGALFTLVTMVLLGGVYHGVVWGIGRVAFPRQAEGSLLRREDGRMVGSRLIAQKFERTAYFHPRPSAVDYNAASTGGSNLGPSNPDHLKAKGDRELTSGEKSGHRPRADSDTWEPAGVLRAATSYRLFYAFLTPGRHKVVRGRQCTPSPLFVLRTWTPVS